MAECEQAYESGARDADAQALALRHALDRLAALGPIRGAQLRVELADALVHFDVAEGDFAGLGNRTLGSFADACVAELLGHEAEAHVVRWALQRDERHLFVCAVPRCWLAAATAAASAHGLQLASLRPHFNAQWNRHMRGQRSGDEVFAVTEGADALIACVRDGAITAVSNGPWNADSGELGDSTVDRLLAGMGLADKKSVALIDIQVDRLLAGLGIDPARARTFTIVGAGEPHVYLSHRWATRRPLGAPA